MNPISSYNRVYSAPSTPTYLHQSIRWEAYEYAMPRKMVKRLAGYDTTNYYFSNSQGDMRERTVETPRYEYDFIPGTEMEEALRKCSTINELINYAIQFRSDDYRRDQAFAYIINIMRGMGINSFESLTTYLRGFNPPVILVQNPQNYPLPANPTSQSSNHNRDQCAIM